MLIKVISTGESPNFGQRCSGLCNSNYFKKPVSSQKSWIYSKLALSSVE